MQCVCVGAVSVFMAVAVACFKKKCVFVGAVLVRCSMQERGKDQRLFLQGSDRAEKNKSRLPFAVK